MTPRGGLRCTVLMLLAGLGGGRMARASSLDDAVATARVALQDGDVRRAATALEAVEETSLGASEIVSRDRLGEALMLRGAALHRRGGRWQSRGMEAWRSALVVSPDLEWDTGLLGDGDDWSVFLALRGEVSARPQVDVGVPERTGAATVHVDGTRVRAGDTVLTGRHLGQIRCDDGRVYGVWTDLSPAPDWLGLCPGGVDTSVEVVEEEQDEWEDMAPVFGSVDGPQDEPVDAGAGADADPGSPSVEASPAEPAPVAPSQTPGAASGLALGTPQIALVGAGGALLVGGTVMYFTMVVPSVNAALDAADSPEDIARDDADDLTARARSRQLLTLGTLGGGVALAAGGLTWAVMLAAPVQPVIGPGLLGLRGRF